MKVLWYCIVILIWLTACKKAPYRSCFKTSGNESERTVTVGDFNRLFLSERMNFVLIQDSTNQVVVKGGENLLQLIEITNEDGLLTITNKNRCNYLRNFDVPLVEIHLTKLVNLHIEGSEKLTNKDTLFTDYLTLTLRDGAGTVDLTLKTIDIKAENTYGWANLTLKGETQTLRANLMGDGCFDVKQLNVTNSLKILTVSSRDQSIRAEGISLQAQIDGIGNILYWGTPSNIFCNKYGTGNLIKQQ
jgi:hypothetical protein